MKVPYQSATPVTSPLSYASGKLSHHSQPPSERTYMHPPAPTTPIPYVPLPIQGPPSSVIFAEDRPRGKSLHGGGIYRGLANFIASICLTYAHSACRTVGIRSTCPIHASRISSLPRSTSLSSLLPFCPFFVISFFSFYPFFVYLILSFPSTTPSPSQLPKNRIPYLFIPFQSGPFARASRTASRRPQH